MQDLSIDNNVTLSVQAQAGNDTAGATYDVLNVIGSRNGSFANVSSDFAYLTPSVSYSGQDVLLTLNTSPSFNDTGFTSSTQSQNANSVR